MPDCLFFLLTKVSHQSGSEKKGRCWNREKHKPEMNKKNSAHIYLAIRKVVLAILPQ